MSAITDNLWLLTRCSNIRTVLAMKGRRRFAQPHDYLNLRGLTRPVVFRPHTTDIPVAWELFRNGEYTTPTWPFRTVVDCGANCGMFLAWALWR
ncbi:MAG: hypothetical protein ACREPS_10825, partial [Rhodanobacteraceae bacterium]